MSTLTTQESTAQSAAYPRQLPFNRRKVASELGKYLVLSLFLIVAVGPVLIMWFSAFKTQQEINANPFAMPSQLRIDNLVQAWTVGRFGRYFWNSVIITLPTVLGVVMLASLAGYGLAKFRFIGKQLFFFLFLLGLMVPFQSIMIPLYFRLRDLGLLGTYFAMILPAIALGLPFGIYLMQAFFRGLPQELSDSARVDGCNEFQVFWRIMLPLARPAVSSLIVFQFMWTWNAFLMPLIYLNREATRPLTLGLMFFQGRYTTDYSLISAGVMIATFPLILLYLFMQRQFVRGLTSGALKG
jgi:raffinose/stachyose/melibiose transport system permease protein